MPRHCLSASKTPPLKQSPLRQTPACIASPLNASFLPPFVSIIGRRAVTVQIYVTKNQEKLGPYSVAEVRARLASGQLSESDVGWHQGLANWLPLPQLLASLPAGPDDPQPPRPKFSGLAVVSLAIGALGIVFWFTIVAIAAIAVSAGKRENSPVMMIAGLFMFAGMGGNLVGIVLGVISLPKNSRNKWMAVIGLILNVVELLGILFLILIGLARR